VHSVGDDATVVLTVTNAANQEDRLLEVTSSAAEEVSVLAGGREREMVVPPLGSTGNFVTLRLRGLTRDLRPGEYVDLALRFERNGSTELLAPVITTGKTDRPIYTGEREEGGEEPGAAGAAGGHHGEDHAGEGEGRRATSPARRRRGRGRRGERLRGLTPRLAVHAAAGQPGAVAPRG
jgi:hypothetical protein